MRSQNPLSTSEISWNTDKVVDSVSCERQNIDDWRHSTLGLEPKSGAMTASHLRHHERISAGRFGIRHLLRRVEITKVKLSRLEPTWVDP